MGIIQQQTLKGAFYSYVGVIIGFITVAVIQPRILSEEQVGLLSLLNDLSATFALFAFLGFGATARYFPYFRSKENKHHGYLFLASAVAGFGFLIACIVILLFKDQIISQESQQSFLFHDYYYYLIPLTFFTLFFSVFELHARMLYDTVASRFLREFIKRALILGAFLLLLSQSIDFESFMPLWLFMSIFPTILLIWYVSQHDEFSFRPNFSFLDKPLAKKMVNISFFAILTGAAPIIMGIIDKYMLNQYFGLEKTGVYSISLYFAVLISMPARSLGSIAAAVVIESWKNNDLQNIAMIYRKSCLNQLLIGALLFIGIWGNIHNVFHHLPTYEAGKYVIFLIGLSNVVDMGTGINGIIISTSRYYRYDALFYAALIIVTVISNLIFIPRYGMLGAAIATAATYVTFNIFRYLFVLKVFKMQPFSWRNAAILLLAACVYGLTRLLPAIDNYIIDLIVRSIFISILYLCCAYWLKLSVDFNNFVNGYLRRWD